MVLPGITLRAWKLFVDNEFKEGVKESHAKKSRKQKEMHDPRHSWKTPIDERGEAWLKGHETRNGTVHSSAVENIKNLKGGGSSFPIGFNFGSLAEVFGPDKGNGNLRGFYSCLSKKRVMQAHLTVAVLENTSSNHNTSFKGFKRDSFSPNIGLNLADDTSTMNLDSTFEGQLNLLSRQGNILATGYVLTGKEAYERKVFIETILDVFTPIWDPPQGDDHYLLFGYVTGGWLGWNEKQLQFVN
ncbi:hypothetical protein MKX01_030684 [Papaver californicum]|nr:hypothetical protein MKX01_030684 [Papaver californicum]